MLFKVNKTKDFCKEREQYFKIQDLKAQLQDKCIVISELRKLFEKLKGKSVDTKFEKSSVIRQPNAFKSQKPSVLGKPTTLSNSFVRKDFSKSTSVTQNNVSNDFSKPVTAQTLPTNKKSILKNTNVLAPGMYKLHTDHTQTRTSQPSLKSNPQGDRVMHNNSQGKKQKVEDHRRSVKLSKNKTSVTACNDSLNAKTLNVKSVSAMCDKCVLHDKHDMCVLKSVSKLLKETIASESNKKPRNFTRKLYERVRVILTTSVSRPQLKSNPQGDRVLRSNSREKKLEVEEHHRNVKLPKNKMSATACNDSLNAKTFNVKSVYAMCTKCVMIDKHDLCVLKSVAKPLKKTVASESNKKPRNNVRKLHERFGKIYKWSYIKFTPSGYMWKPKSPKGNVNSNHMTRNLKLLINFVEKFLGTVKFWNAQIAPILGYGDLVQGAVTIKRVYYVEGLNHNLFSVGQFYDADLEVAFRKSTCFIRDLKGNDLFTGSRGTDLYSITLQSTTSPNPICLMAKETSSQAWLWHRCLSHLNFDTINLLSKNDIVTLNAFFQEEGIEHQTSTTRTPKQNGVVERRNGTLVEAARTMLPASKLPLFFWAEAIATAKEFRDGENLDKMKEKKDLCILVGYSTQSKGYRVYNKRTRMIVESIH
nr:integrase, catalytic region, zinc finger, CCHC-type, peptidase aspartic, catalytic [Tanacetum cinerariifolium]